MLIIGHPGGAGGGRAPHTINPTGKERCWRDTSGKKLGTYFDTRSCGSTRHNDGLSREIREAFQFEFTAACAARRAGDLSRAFAHLERAHILAQRITGLHVRAHLGMLAIGWQRRDAREVAGQVARIVAATLFSRMWIPEGNTGGANVSAMRPMPVPPDLAAILATVERTCRK